MMRRRLVATLLLLCVAALACGKYGKPERIAASPAESAEEASDDEAERKNRKP